MTILAVSCQLSRQHGTKHNHSCCSDNGSPSHPTFGLLIRFVVMPSPRTAGGGGGGGAGPCCQAPASAHPWRVEPQPEVKETWTALSWLVALVAGIFCFAQAWMGDSHGVSLGAEV